MMGHRWFRHEGLHAAGRGRGHRGGRRGWGGGGGWGDGPPNPFAQMFRGGFRARRGDVRAAILLLLDDEPRNGYQLMQELERRSEGTWRPSSGSVYPTLAQLEDEGLVTASKDEANRIFKLTERGKAYVAKHKDELGTPWQVDDSGGEVRHEVSGMLRELGTALVQVARFGSPEQVSEAKKILAEARRALYRILADDQ